MHTHSVLAPRAALPRLAATTLVFGALYKGCNLLTQARSGIGLVLSVLATWQHQVIDIPAGMAGAGLSLWLAGHWTIGAPWSNPSATALVSIASSRRAAACSPTASR